jgi:hypothetical protein
MSQDFKVGDIVTCIDCAEKHGFYNSLTHQYKIPFSDDYILLTLGVDYTIYSITKHAHDVNIIDILTLEELPAKEVDNYTLFTRNIFKAERFVLNVSETRKKKINSLYDDARI